MEFTHRQPVRFIRLSSFQRGRVLEHLLRLDPEDRACRFGRATSDDDIRRYWERIDWARTVAIGCEIDGELRGLGELKAIGDGWGAVAEAAVTVERAYQGRRIGSELFRRLATLARNRGIRTLNSVCLALNRKVQRMAVRYGAELTQYDGELEGQIDLPWPSWFSFVQEMIDATVQEMIDATIGAVAVALTPPPPAPAQAPA